MVAPAAHIWPATLPNPVANPHDFIVNMGVSRVRMQAGNTKQRRMFRHMPTQWGLAWQVDTKHMMALTKWIHQFGTDWFECPVVSMYAARNGKIIDLLTCRVIGDLSIAPDGHNLWRVSTEVEISPEIYQKHVIVTKDWIIAGNPASPSAPDWYIGGTPALPSVDTVLPGRPGAPNATV